MSEVWSGRCPNCGSCAVGIVDNDEVSWGNDDEGYLCEYWSCEACLYRFTVKAMVEVTNRKVMP